MTTDATGTSESIDDLVARLRRRVEERKRAGEYPPELLEDLDGHFARIAPHRFGADDLTALKAKVEGLQRASSFTPAAIHYGTRVPGGSLIHRVLGRLVRRQTEGILAQAQAHADALLEALWEVVAALESPASHTHVEISGDIDAIFAKLAAFERSRAAAGNGLLPRIEALESRAAASVKPWYASTEFEERFRGERDEIRSRYRDLALLFRDAPGVVVDIGCGRGEFVELLLETGVEAEGIDIDSSLVRECVERGLPVSYGEAEAWLTTTSDQTIGGLSLLQVVEHLSRQTMIDVVQLAARKVRPGGRVVVETVNPQSLYTFAHAFYIDPTHYAPVHPAFLMFLFQQAGFTDVSVQWRSPTPPEDQLQPIDGPLDAMTIQQLNANNDRVNQLLFAHQDYAVIAVR